MKILVCVKQVPDGESLFRVNDAGTWYDEDDLAWRMNEYDEFAVEQALLLKEQQGDGSDVTVLSIGPERVRETVRKALAMGCDRGVHIIDPAPHMHDPWQIASIIAAYAQGSGFDIIFTGMQSQDRGSAQVGVMVAELLGMACVTTVVGFSYADGSITIRRELEGGQKGVVSLGLPVLVTCQLGLNSPRYPTLPGIMKAKKKELSVVRVEELCHESPRSATTGFHAPLRREGGVVIEGDPAEQVERLIAILRENTSVLRSGAL